jgi:hypothetical protein
LACISGSSVHRLFEQAGIRGIGIVGVRLDLEDREISIARRGEISCPVGPSGSEAAIDHDVMVWAQRVWIDHGRYRFRSREALVAQRDRLFGPAQRRQLALEFCDPPIAAGVAEKDNVIFREIGGRNIGVVFDADMAPICQRILPVEPLEHAQSLLIRRRVPRGTRGTNN